ncbi:MAG: HNH endonuclease [Richelia sp.]|nr:HNH endonuclease [Richelia sp.]
MIFPQQLLFLFFQQTLSRDNQQCQVCGKEHSGQVHHIIPISQGGTN